MQGQSVHLCNLTPQEAPVGRGGLQGAIPLLRKTGMYLFLIYLYRSFIHFKGGMGNVLIHKKYLSKSMIGYVA